MAAIAVIASHSFALLNKDEPVTSLTGVPLGLIAVGTFFVISGYLMSYSWKSDPDVKRYTMRRALRLLPGLVVAVFLTTFVIGLSVTSLSAVEYLSKPATWIYWLRTSILITPDGMLPGVFEQAPYPNAVNGSLWTLPVEVVAYGIIAVLGILSLLAKTRLLIVLGIFGLLLSTVFQLVVSPQDGTLLFILGVRGVWLWSLFVLAAAFAEMQPKINGKIVLAWLAVWVISWPTPLSEVFTALAILYTTLYLAHTRPVGTDFFKRHGDWSYGVYIYAFPIQQLLVSSFNITTPLSLFISATIISLFLGCMSWKFVEKPALKHKPSRPKTEIATEITEHSV